MLPLVCLVFFRFPLAIAVQYFRLMSRETHPLLQPGYTLLQPDEKLFFVDPVQEKRVIQFHSYFRNKKKKNSLAS